METLFAVGTVRTMILAAMCSVGLERACPTMLDRLFAADPRTIEAAFAQFKALPADERLRLIPAIAAKLGDSERRVRETAADLLAEIGAEAGAAGPRLIELVRQEKDSQVRISAVQAVAALGHDNPLVLPALIDFLKMDSSIASHSRGALLRAGAPGLDAALRASTLPDPKQRSAALIAAKEFLADEWAAGFQKGLIERLRAQGQEVTVSVPPPYPDPGPRSSEIVPTIARALDDPDADVRLTAVVLLGEVGDAARPALPRLIPFAEHSELELRREAIAAIGKIGPKDAAAVPALIRSLKHPDNYVRHYAAFALREIGPPARAAAAALKPLLDDGDQHVREYAAEALERIGAPLR